MLAGIWAYGRASFEHIIRVQMICLGWPHYDLRITDSEELPDGHARSLAYRRTVYVGGQYVGWIERFGMFCPPDDQGPSIRYLPAGLAMLTVGYASPWRYPGHAMVLAVGGLALYPWCKRCRVTGTKMGKTRQQDDEPKVPGVRSEH